MESHEGQNILLKGLFINIPEKKESYFNIFFSGKEGKQKKNYIDKGDKIKKIIVKIDYGIKSLNKLFKDGDVITPEVLKERGIIKKQLSGIKVLSAGVLDKKLTIKAHRFSTSAVTKIEAAGGKAEVI